MKTNPELHFHRQLEVIKQAIQWSIAGMYFI